MVKEKSLFFYSSDSASPLLWIFLHSCIFHEKTTSKGCAVDYFHMRLFMKSNKMFNDLKMIHLSNCPMGVDVIPYDNDEDVRSEAGKYFGEKIFYMRVQYEEGDVTSNKSKFDDWGWLSRSEIVARVKDEKGENSSLFYHYML